MDAFRAIAASARYKDLHAAVPTSVAVEHPGGAYRFAAPWPWFVVEDETARLSSGDVVQLAAPRRSGDWPAVAVSVDSGGGTFDDSEVGRMARSLAKARGGRARSPRRIRLDGERALDLSVESADAVSHVVIVPTPQRTITIEFECMPAVAAGYEVHLDAMLATWRWA